MTSNVMYMVYIGSEWQTKVSCDTQLLRPTEPKVCYLGTKSLCSLSSGLDVCNITYHAHILADHMTAATPLVLPVSSDH